MPPIDVVLGSWSIDWVALALIFSAGYLYLRGFLKARRRHLAWSWWRVFAFYVLGLGSFAVLSLGFPAVFSHELRWVFTIKIAGSLFVVPLLLGLGKPLTLARHTLGSRGAARLENFLNHIIMRTLANSAVAALLGLALFAVFLTPAFFLLRTSALAGVLITILVPVIGLLMTSPILEDGSEKTINSLIIVEFIYVFMELIDDAVPGIIMRISGNVLDGASSAILNAPGWFPNPLRDQQLAGDLLWFIAEIVDLPLLILMFVRFQRSEKKESTVFDELSDEELESLNEAHLQGSRSSLHG